MISIATHSKPWLQHPPFLGTKCILPVQICTDGVSCIFRRSEWKTEASISHFHSRRNHRMGHKCHQGQGHHQAQTGCFLPWGGTFSLAQCHPWRASSVTRPLCQGIVDADPAKSRARSCADLLLGRRPGLHLATDPGSAARRLGRHAIWPSWKAGTWHQQLHSPPKPSGQVRKEGTDLTFDPTAASHSTLLQKNRTHPHIRPYSNKNTQPFQENKQHFPVHIWPYPTLPCLKPDIREPTPLNNHIHWYQINQPPLNNYIHCYQINKPPLNNYIHWYQINQPPLNNYSLVSNQPAPLAQLYSLVSNQPAPLEQLHSLVSNQPAPLEQLHSLLSNQPAPLEQLHSLLSNQPAPLEQLHSLVSNQPAPLEQLHSLVSNQPAPPAQLHSLASNQPAPLEQLYSLVSNQPAPLAQLYSLVSNQPAPLEKLHSLLSNQTAPLEQLHSLLWNQPAPLEQLHSLLSNQPAPLEQWHSLVSNQPAPLEQLHSLVSNQPAPLEQLHSLVSNQPAPLEQVHSLVSNQPAPDHLFVAKNATFSHSTLPQNGGRVICETIGVGSNARRVPGKSGGGSVFFLAMPMFRNGLCSMHCLSAHGAAHQHYS